MNLPEWQGLNMAIRTLEQCVKVRRLLWGFLFVLLFRGIKQACEGIHIFMGLI